MAFILLFFSASTFYFFNQDILVIFIVIISSLICFFLFHHQLCSKKYIYDKIRPIYKTIFNLKAPKGKDNKQAEPNGDMIVSVNQQVIKWAEDKKEEIEELKKLEVYRREFLGNVSHELKTPIFNIQGYVLTLLDGGIDDPGINREYLLRTEKSINRMINIVEDLESISKLESGEFKPVYSRFDMVVLVKEVFEFLEMNSEKKNIKFHFDKHYDKPVFVNADKEKIGRCLLI